MKLKMRATSRPIAGVGGEEGDVGVDAGGDRVIIAGPEVTVVDQRAHLAPHHHRELGVGLELDEAVDDLRARPLEIPRPADVGLFVETRLELDERGDRLAGLRRLDQGSDDRAVGRGAVERLLDRDDIRIVRRLVEELNDDVERFVRVVDDEILLPDRGEAIAAELLDPLGKSRVVRRKLEVRAVDRHQLRQIVERQHSFDQHDPRRDDVDVAGDEGTQRFRRAGLDLKPDDGAAPAPLERALVEADEVFRLFLDFDVAVANDAKGALAQHFIARKQQADEGDDQPIEHHEARGAAERPVRQPDEALDAAGNADQRAHRRAVAADSGARAPGVNPRLGMKGNGCAGSTASGVRIGNTWERK